MFEFKRPVITAVFWYNSKSYLIGAAQIYL